MVAVQVCECEIFESLFSTMMMLKIKKRKTGVWVVLVLMGGKRGACLRAVVLQERYNDFRSFWVTRPPPAEQAGTTLQLLFKTHIMNLPRYTLPNAIISDNYSAS